MRGTLDDMVMLAHARRYFRWHFIEEKLYWHVECSRKIEEPTRCDAIRASLIFLKLLERHAERSGQLLLAYSEHAAAEPHPAVDMIVNRTPADKFPPALTFSRPIGRHVRSPHAYQ